MENRINESSADAYEGWAIVELMGHRQIAGRVSQANQYGAAQLRVDVPGNGDDVVATQFYGGAAIYCLTPCDEATARRALENKYSLPEPVRLALPKPGDDRLTPDVDADLCDEFEGHPMSHHSDP